MADDEYKITEDDIQAVLNLLKIIDPKKATPEVANAVLERMYLRTHMLEHFDQDAIEEILKDLEDH